jgi:hypothetical protein
MELCIGRRFEHGRYIAMNIATTSTSPMSPMHHRHAERPGEIAQNFAHELVELGLVGHVPLHPSCVSRMTALPQPRCQASDLQWQLYVDFVEKLGN